MNNKPFLFGIIGIFIWTCAVYLPSLDAGFIWDDDGFLTENRLIKADDGLYRFWFTRQPPDYFPLVSTTLWLEWRIWERNPRGYHLANILLHALSSVLLALVLRRLNVPGAVLAALVFAVHPVNVESVAWITQRKNVLPMVFYLSAILAYLQFEDTNRRRLYWAALGLFLLALLSKTSVVMLPVVFLGIAWWRRNRIVAADVYSSVPFFALSLVLAVVTIWFQYNRAGAATVRDDGFVSRLVIAAHAVWFYLEKAIFTWDNLMFVYPRWKTGQHSLSGYIPLLALAGCFLIFWICRNRWGRACLAGFGYFCVTLFPVLGFFNIYFMRYSLVADHWQYFSIPGILALIIGGGWYAAAKWSLRGRRLAAALAVLLVPLLSKATWDRQQAFKNEENLWRDTLAKNTASWMPTDSLAILLANRGYFEEAANLFRRVIHLNPSYANAYSNLGNCLAKRGMWPEAIDQYNMALQYNPAHVKAHYNLAIAFEAQGRFGEAADQYEETLKLSPKDVNAHVNLGVLLARQGKIDYAVGHFSEALNAEPGHAGAAYNLKRAMDLRKPRSGGPDGP